MHCASGARVGVPSLRMVVVRDPCLCSVPGALVCECPCSGVGGLRWVWGGAQSPVGSPIVGYYSPKSPGSSGQLDLDWE